MGRPFGFVFSFGWGTGSGGDLTVVAVDCWMVWLADFARGQGLTCGWGKPKAR